MTQNVVFVLWQQSACIKTPDTRPLYWMRKVFGIGYVSQRCDGMSELRINGYARVRDILTQMLPYIRFKKVQANAMIRACDILANEKFSELGETQLRELVELVQVVQNENYSSRQKRTRSELLKQLGLTP